MLLYIYWIPEIKSIPFRSCYTSGCAGVWEKLIFFLFSVFFFGFLKRAGGQQHGSAANVQRHTVPGSQTHYQVDSLSSGGSSSSTTAQQTTFYEIWVTAANRAGVGDKSKVLRFSPNSKGEIEMNLDYLRLFSPKM